MKLNTAIKTVIKGGFTISTPKYSIQDVVGNGIVMLEHSQTHFGDPIEYIHGTGEKAISKFIKLTQEETEENMSENHDH